MTSSDTPAAGALKPGDRIGNYEIRQQLGSGGQAIVYKGYDGLLDRFVAIKQISPALAQDEKYRGELRDNLKTIARLGQKNEAIVTTLELIEDDRGLFYVMEFVEGHTLETLLQEADGPIEVKATLLILFRLASALHDVHAEGICHRDMKPSNVIITEGLRPKIIDFGVATNAGADASMPLATTKYLAPEVYEDRTVDARADLYSLGFIVYEMLLGRPKFNEVFADVVRDRHSAVVRWMKWHGNPSVSAPPAHEVNPAVPLSLSRIVEKMIRKDPDHRYASTEELGRDIKSSFSPKGRKPAGAAAPPPQAAAGSGDSETLAKLRQPTGIGTLEGEELEVPSPTEPAPPPAQTESYDPLRETLDREGDLPDAAPTAPLPKGPMSRKRKLTLLAVAAGLFVVILGGGIALMLQISARNAERMQSASAVYKQASEAYKQQSYVQAREGFEDVLSRHPQTLQGRLSRVMAPLARAQEAIESGNWDTAQLQERAAEQAAKELQAETTDPKQADWTRRRLDEIAGIRRKRRSYRAFADAVARAKAALSQPAPTGQIPQHFQRIQRDLEDALSAAGVELTAQQDQAVADLRRTIERQRITTQLETLMSQGEEHLQARRLDEAETAFQQARDLLSSNDPAVGLLGASRRKELLETLRGKQQAMIRRARQEQVLAAVRKAEDDRNMPALESALIEALKLPGLSDEQRQAYRKRLEDIRIEAALAKARGLIEQSNPAGAREALKRVLELSPGHAEATALMANLDRQAKLKEQLARGDRAYTAGNYAEALQHYTQAAQNTPSEVLRTKIANCKFELKLAEADRLVEAGQYPQAEQAYAEARQLQPARADRVDARLLKLRTRRQYERFLAEGDEALKANRWQDAIRWYTQAQQTLNTPAVAKRIDLTHYKKFITLGRNALADEDFAVARWNFKQALKYMETPEARKLLQQAEQEQTD